MRNALIIVLLTIFSVVSCTVEKVTLPLENEESWNSGVSVDIAGTQFNKTAFSHLSSVAISENITVNDASFKNKIVFVNKNVTINFGSGAVLKNTVIVSKDELSKVRITGSKVNASNLLAFKNIDFDNNFTVVGKDLKEIYFDGCNLPISTDSDALIDLTSNATKSGVNVSLADNVIHSTRGDTQISYSLISGSNSVSFNKVFIEDNMFLNIKGNDNTLLFGSAIAKLSIERNHFNYSDSLNDSFEVVSCESYPSSSNLSIDSNSYFPNGGSAVISTNNVNFGKFKHNPLSSTDIPSGEYTYCPKYNSANYLVDGEVRCPRINGDKIQLLHLPNTKNIELYVLPGCSYSLSGNLPSSRTVAVTNSSGTNSYTMEFPDMVSESTNQILKSNNSGWTTVWAEEFSDSDWDREVWVRCPPDSPDWEKEQYPDDESLVQVTDGHLVTWAKKDNDTNKGNNGYICGGIWGKDLKGFNLGMNGVNGRIDVRARMTDAQGYWPAIWMLSEPQQAWAFGGEIDLMEHLNYENTVYSTLHWSENNAGEDLKRGVTVNKFTDRTSWHVFTVLVINNTIYIYIDGVQYMSYAKGSKTALQWPWDTTEYFMILDSQLNGGWVGNATGADLPAHMDIDYVRYMVKN